MTERALAHPLGMPARAFSLHRVWHVTGGTFVAVLVAVAAWAPSVLVLPLGRDLGWGTASISSALAVR